MPRASAAVPPKRQLRANLVSAREARPKTPTASRPSSSSFQIARVPRCPRAGTPTSRRRRRANAVHDADLPRRRQRCHRSSAGPVARGRRPFGRGHDSLSREGLCAPRARSRAGRVPTGSKRSKSSAVTTGLATLQSSRLSWARLAARFRSPAASVAPDGGGRSASPTTPSIPTTAAGETVVGAASARRRGVSGCSSSSPKRQRRQSRDYLTS